MKIIRVFPRKTNASPTDDLCFFGRPPKFNRPMAQKVMVSCTFTWDMERAKFLRNEWAKYYDNVQIGGPAFDDKGGEFIPGLFLKSGKVITSRGCIRNCKFCFVPKREGKLRELKIHDGHDVYDNNLLACSRNHIENVFNMLKRQSKPAIFSGGLDIRLLEDWHVNLLRSIKLSHFFVACDSDDIFPILEKARKLLDDFNMQQRRCYVLMGFENDTIEKANNRAKAVLDLGFYPFAMLFQSSIHRKYNKEWKSVARFWLRPAIYKTLLKTGVVNEI